MSAYGYEIVQTLIVDIEPDEHVKRAMNEINAGELSMIVSRLFSVNQVSLMTNWILMGWTVLPGYVSLSDKLLKLVQLQGWG